MHRQNVSLVQCNVTFFLFLQFQLCDIRIVDLTRRCKPLVFAFYYYTGCVVLLCCFRLSPRRGSSMPIQPITISSSFFQRCSTTSSSISLTVCPSLITLSLSAYFDLTIILVHTLYFITAQKRLCFYQCVFDRVFVCLLTELLINSYQFFIQGPVDQILNDLDQGQGHQKSQGQISNRGRWAESFITVRFWRLLTELRTVKWVSYTARQLAVAQCIVIGPVCGCVRGRQAPDSQLVQCLRLSECFFICCLLLFVVCCKCV